MPPRTSFTTFRKASRVLLIRTAGASPTALVDDVAQRVDPDAHVVVHELGGHLLSLASVFTPQGTMGWSLTSSSAPGGSRCGSRW